MADGILALMALMVDESLATGDVPGPRHGLLPGRYACYDSYPTRDGGWLSVAAIEPQFWANLCRLLELDQWATRQTDDAVQDEIRADVARRVPRPATATTGSRELSRRPTRASPPVLSIPEVVQDAQYPAAARSSTRPIPSTARSDRSGTRSRAPPRPPSPSVRDATTTETDELLAAAGFSADDIAKLRDAGVVA